MVPIAAALRQVKLSPPLEKLAPLPVFHHAGFWLLTVAIGYGIAAGLRAQWPGIVRGAMRSARSPVLVTLVFIVMAVLMAASGIAAQFCPTKRRSRRFER